MRRQLSKNTLQKLVQAENIEKLSLEQIKKLFENEADITKYAPDGICQIDPRSGDRIVFNSARARRPHDNRSGKKDEGQPDAERDCLICQGKTTKIIDTADLSEGFTFINKNLYPIFYPNSMGDLKNVDEKVETGTAAGYKARGFHFLQWTSSFHDKDWHNMPLDDRLIVMKRLAALERKLADSTDMYVSIIKNYGHLVGGSLEHGHQQIGVSNIMPNRCRQNEKFVQRYGEYFSTYMLRENPDEFLIKDYGSAALVTPYYMRRPYDMLLIVKNASKSYLYELDDKELAAAAEGWRDGIRIMLKIMPQIGKETAYNVVTHNGPGAGLYFEFLPYTQETGGFEHLGLYLCQGNPKDAADNARTCLSDTSKKEGDF